MTVAPQVSTGRINPTSKLPDKESTEVTTTSLLADSQAFTIGGLIKETSNNSQNKIPFFGDLWVVGKLFQSRDVLKERNEFIITLLPRIARPEDYCSSGNEEDYNKRRLLCSTAIWNRSIVGHGTGNCPTPLGNRDGNGSDGSSHKPEDLISRGARSRDFSSPSPPREEKGS